MGHLLPLGLPGSKAWREVVRLIEEGSSADRVVAQATRAAERALSGAVDDPAFLATAHLLVELPLAARGPGFLSFLDEIAVPETALASRTAFLVEVGRSLDRTSARTDLGEMARQELVRSLAEELDRRLPGLFPETPADVRTALGQLAGGDGFARFTRRFFAGLVDRTLSYYLSRALAEHTGADRRFASDADRVSFERALTQHAWDVSAIVEEYASGWYGKNIWHGDGPTPEKIRGFASYAFTKLRRGLAEHRNA